MQINTIGVIGAGIMGSGMAQVMAQAGYDVRLIDISSEVLENAKQRLRNNVRQMKLLKTTAQPYQLSAIMQHITFSFDYQQLAEVDFVIENVTEKWEIKRDVFALIDTICQKEVIFATNTSAIPVTRLASKTQRPQQVIGTHFMNPVPLKSMVEVIRGYHTSEETIQTVKNVLRSIGKQWVIVNDSPGFVTNRILMLTINEAIFLLHDQVSTAEEIDILFKGCFEHQMGPLETADLIGLDTILFSIEVLYENFNDDKYRPCPLLKKMVHAGLYGRKSGQGFYVYR